MVFRDIPEYRSLFNGSYLNAKSTEEFICLTTSLLTNPDFYRVGVDLSKEVIKEFDKEGIKQQLLELYRSVLNIYYQIEQKHN